MHSVTRVITFTIWFVTFFSLLGCYLGIYAPLLRVEWTKATNCHVVDGSVTGQGMTERCLGPVHGTQLTHARIRYTLPSGEEREGIACASTYSRSRTAEALFTGGCKSRYPYHLASSDPSVYLCSECGGAYDGAECMDRFFNDLASKPTCHVSSPTTHPGKTPYVMLERSSVYLPPGDFWTMVGMGGTILLITSAMLLADCVTVVSRKVQNGSFEALLSVLFGIDHVPLWNVNHPDGPTRVPTDALMKTATVRAWLDVAILLGTVVLFCLQADTIKHKAGAVTVGIGFSAAVIQHVAVALAHGPWSTATKRSGKDWLAREAVLVPWGIVSPCLPLSGAERITLWLRQSGSRPRLAFHYSLIGVGVASGWHYADDRTIDGVLVGLVGAWMVVCAVCREWPVKPFTAPKLQFTSLTPILEPGRSGEGHVPAAVHLVEVVVQQRRQQAEQKEEGEEEKEERYVPLARREEEEEAEEAEEKQADTVY